MTFPELRERLAGVRERIAAHQARAGWSHPVRVVAVTKGHGPDAVRAAAAVHVDAVGENRIQEALEKQAVLPELRVAWHFVGRLQRNKARLAAGRFALIHSVDRLDLARELDRRMPAGQPPQPVLVQVNCSGEPQKGGVEPGELLPLLAAVEEFPRLELRGLMTMAEFSPDPEVQRRAFHLLRTLRESAASAGHSVVELSMGMSADYPIAVEEGATMIRLGTLLFGGPRA